MPLVTVCLSTLDTCYVDVDVKTAFLLLVAQNAQVCILYTASQSISQCYKKQQMSLVFQYSVPDPQITECTRMCVCVCVCVCGIEREREKERERERTREKE